MKIIEIEVSDKLAAQIQMARNCYGEPYASDQIRSMLSRWASRVLLGRGKPNLFHIATSALLEAVEVGIKSSHLKRLHELPPAQKGG